MALCTTTEFVPERMESGECIRDLGRHHNETNRLPSQYDSTASMALNQRLPLRLARVAKPGTLGRLIAWMALVRALI